MITRRNWLLRCSILINIAVLLYICSHVIIGNSNVSIGPSFVMQDEYNVKPQIHQQQQAQIVYQEAANDAVQVNLLPQKEPAPQWNAISGDQQPEQVHENENIEDTRFEMPTEQSVIQQQQQPQQQPKSGGAGDVVYQDVNLMNTSTNEGFTMQNEEKDIETRLKLLYDCHNKDYLPETIQRGDFWVLKNYIRADHGELRCFETITYITHADYTFLDNLIPMLERWNAPVSIALHAPGTDLVPTIKAIKYLRDCAPGSQLVRQFTTFHIYFSGKHMPKFVPKYDKVLDQPYNCSLPSPFTNISSAQLYKTQKKLLYPINMGRNTARDAAMTHFILVSDIELYPNPGLVRKFLEMVARNDAPLQRKNPKVFPLPIFEVDSTSQVPRDKTELQELLKKGKAIPFHKRVCASCHGVPKSKEWMAANETEELNIFHIGKRVGYFVHWEPIYIGTHADPHYDERLSWEGKSDKMTQGYALCALDYEFQILDNAFLVHKPGIKVLKKDTKRAMLAAKTNQLIKKIIYPELQVLYGVRKGCSV
ncbi:Beta-1,4-glucuronyltransferase 1 [Pseudolycoriella hygida]|uniref:Beta-1,4-glucuronyltransferase 1 n=1 Tax=Pseudolycoriella hygida TaxID=35572 RepID=A0A9Q0NGI4_9DIPT|nr:Beta-1,4-glucuronyltransferase 1 [Pseudolycoriella hygida]